MTAVIDKPVQKPGRWAAPPRPVWEEQPSQVGLAGKGLVLGIACFAILFPLWIVVVTSISSRKTIDEAGGQIGRASCRERV